MNPTDRLFRPLFSLPLWFLVLGAFLVQPGVADERLDFFESEVRPLLVEHCYGCHNAAEASAQLRLDVRAGWVRGGKSGPAIVPGDPTASLLVRAINATEGDLQMPPADAGRRLTREEVNTLVTWIRQGAVDPRDGSVVGRSASPGAHWAFQQVQVPEVPADVHPIDYLIRRQHMEAGVQPVGPATDYDLIRRAVFDLHGLPPNADQLATPRAEFAQLVDALLESPRYGERWGRHWLDVARYSDAKDGVLMYGDARIRPFAYTYRDYVIRAFNDDKPFDRFILEQLAADQLGLPEHAPELAGMGLLTLGRMFDRNRHDVIDDQIDVVSRGFLGLTVSCARCHDHKFDPIPTADYYSLHGVFASSQEPYDRPRIEPITEEGRAFEEEFSAKLQEVRALRKQRYEETLSTARRRTGDYLVEVVTTEPDLAETAIFFLSLIPEQLRPQITYRWRKLIARRAFPEDRIFGPWHDLMLDPQRHAFDESGWGQIWRARDIEPCVIEALLASQPRTPIEIAKAYGRLFTRNADERAAISEEIVSLERQRRALARGSLDLADVIAGGDGLGTGKPGAGIHPGTGAVTTGETGFVREVQTDQFVEVPTHPFVDGVFVPKSEPLAVTSTGLRIEDLPDTSGQTWDYFKPGASSGFTSNTIDGVDYTSDGHWMIGIHANKGITFDLEAMRASEGFKEAQFVATLGHGGAKGESKIDFFVYLDGKQVESIQDFEAQQAGKRLQVDLPADGRFLTLVVLEGAQGISHDQAILGDPQIVLRSRPKDAWEQKLAGVTDELTALRDKLAELEVDANPLTEFLESRESPVWFPINDVYYYLSRQQKDAFRGLVGQLDAISVKHAQAAGRAMVLVDSEQLYDPVIFQRGDPSQRGAPVPRQFLSILADADDTPFSHGSGRLDLARAIASPDNPLTARVWVNRVWMHHFGKPLVNDPSDFGLRTEPPVQQALLDYLAAELVIGGWKTKDLHRLIMSSEAYQRSSLLPPTAQIQKQLRDDPDNRLIWRANRRRLDLEQMRDTMLAISGQLDLAMYGRPGLITDSENHRRTVYAFVERQNLPNIVQVFDFANADSSTARRVKTIVPQQALFAMNSDFIRATAEALATRAQADEKDPVARSFQIVFGRDPDPDERSLAERYLAGRSFESFAQVLLMSNELMFVD